MHIVILPGLDGTGKILGVFIAALEAKYSIEIIDYPAKTLLSYIELANLVLGKLPKDVPYVIIAESFSGPIAVKVATQAQKNLKGIIFAASFVKNPIALPKRLAALTKAQPLKSSTALSLAKPFTFGKWASKDLQTLLTSAIDGVSHEVIVHRLNEVMSIDERVKFSSIKVPMLYLRPRADRLVSKSTASEMRTLNQKIHIEEIEGPHFILQTHRAVCVEKISHFIEKSL